MKCEKMSFNSLKYAYYSFGVATFGAYVVFSFLHPMYHFRKAENYLKLKGYPHPIHKIFRPEGHLEDMKKVIEQWPPTK